MWLKDTEDDYNAELEIEVVNPHGKTVKTFNNKLQMPGSMKRLRFRLKVSGLTVEEPGNYLFKVNFRELGHKTYKIVAELPLEVKINKQIDASAVQNPIT